MIVSLLTIGLLFIPSSNAFWRLPCSQPVLNARVDPIISQGKPSNHAHSIMGSSAIGFDTTFDDLVNSNCTTCMVNDDKSAYWVSLLYYQFPNGSFQAVPHGGMLVYYLQRSGPNETVEAFPDGLRIFTGDPLVRNYTGTPESQAISWLCIDFNGPAQQQTPVLTNTTCPDGLRAQVFHPSCWDGVNLDSPDHKSHMAYPRDIDNGPCPPSHPVHLISLFYEVWFSVDSFNKLDDGGRFTLSTGDPTGASLHADFLDGWNKDVLSRAVETCTAESGVIQDCPVFNDENRFVPDAVMNSCAAPNPLPSEDVIGPIPYLPGCVAVTEGPGPATEADLDPNCVSSLGNQTLLQNTNSSPMPPSSSPANPQPSTMPASGDDSVPSSSPSSPLPSTMPASGDNSVPSSSPASPLPSTMPASGDYSVPSSSPVSPLPSSMPASGDYSIPSSSPAGPPSSTMPSPGDCNCPCTCPQPTQPPSNVDLSPSGTTPPNSMTSPADPPSSNNNPYNPSPSPSSSLSPSFSPGPASMDPGAVLPTTSITQPSSMPPNDPVNTTLPQEGDGSDGDDYCSESSPPANNTARDALRSMRRRHHARRAGHGSHTHH